MWKELPRKQVPQNVSAKKNEMKLYQSKDDGHESWRFLLKDTLWKKIIQSEVESMGKVCNVSSAPMESSP